MALQLGDTAPDFTQDSTEGPLHFYDWAGDSWVVLFSHPKDFTPVCTTELGAVAKLKPEFDRRGVKVLGLSVDLADSHAGWAADIEATLRVIDSLQLTDGHKVATPANWRQGEDVIIVPSVKDEEARSLFPGGWTEHRPYLRTVRQPG